MQESVSELESARSASSAMVSARLACTSLIIYDSSEIPRCLGPASCFVCTCTSRRKDWKSSVLMSRGQRVSESAAFALARQPKVHPGSSRPGSSRPGSSRRPPVDGSSWRPRAPGCEGVDPQPLRTGQLGLFCHAILIALRHLSLHQASNRSCTCGESKVATVAARALKPEWLGPAAGLDVLGLSHPLRMLARLPLCRRFLRCLRLPR